MGPPRDLGIILTNLFIFEQKSRNQIVTGCMGMLGKTMFIFTTTVFFTKVTIVPVGN
jgi:hypothetical protein